MVVGHQAYHRMVLAVNGNVHLIDSRKKRMMNN